MKKLLLILNYFLLSFDYVQALRIDYNNVCNNSSVGSAMVILGYVIEISKWIVPLIIIVLGMIDFGKAMISNDDSSINKASVTLIRRLIAGVVIFFIPTIISVFTKNILDTNIENEFLTCTSCVFNPNDCKEYVELLKEQEKEYDDNMSYDDSSYTSTNSHTSSINGIKYKLYNQSDPLWSDVEFSNGKTIGDIGCAITSVAVLSSAYDADITPKTVFDIDEYGWPHESVTTLSKNSFSCTKESSLDSSYIKHLLKSGNVVITRVEDESPFTGAQHYMALIDIKADESEIFVGNSYGSGTASYNRNGWFKSSDVFTDVQELFVCRPSQDLLNKFKKGNSGSEIISSPDITLSSEFKTDSSLRYLLYTPSSATKVNQVPLIVWLHGSGEINTSEQAFGNSGLPNVLNNWSLYGFNAYVLCPIATSGSWLNIRTQVYNLIEEIIDEKNINTNKIILVGHSMGGIGVQHIADNNSSYFSSLVILSGYNASNVDLNQFSGMPIRAYAGDKDTGEDLASYNYTVNNFASVFGTESYRILQTYHGGVPNMAFNLDENNDNKSDLVEWMLSQ